VRPLWFLWEDGYFWLLSGAWSSVPARIGTDPVAALVVDTCDLLTGETVQVVARGRAEVVAFDVARCRGGNGPGRLRGGDPDPAWPRGEARYGGGISMLSSDSSVSCSNRRLNLIDRISLRHEGDDELSGVAIEVLAAAVVGRGRTRIGMTCSSLHVTERNASVEHGHDERSSRPVQPEQHRLGGMGAVVLLGGEQEHAELGAVEASFCRRVHLRPTHVLRGVRGDSRTPDIGR